MIGINERICQSFDRYVSLGQIEPVQSALVHGGESGCEEICTLLVEQSCNLSAEDGGGDVSKGCCEAPLAFCHANDGSIPIVA